ncbi:MAG: UbiH/UbiF/VisC/COQ6 family ubiquinone biosynthesis hydroxylase [Gammaproteobacteria bacterium]|nr:UbiH/UbiF/VisC/COQ6 family ubiquinone biosynthesis hydroxylase [Gammaproteobacteria bacterium]
MKHDHDITIVGGGMVGLTAACLLSKHDALKITLIDAGKKPVFDVADDMSLRVSAVAPGSVDILSGVGAWEEISNTRACPYRGMKVWDAAGNMEGPETLCFDAAEFAVPQLGYIVENELIRHSLLRQLEKTAVSVCFETPIVSFARAAHRFEIELESGEKLTPDLLIGADGARSFIRGKAGIQIKSWQHMQKALVTCLQPELSHRNTAWQRFLKDGPIGMLPLSDGRISIVWSTTAEQADAALAMSDEELSAILTEVTDGVLGVLSPAGPRGAFPLESQHATEYVQDGLALIGDAAHTIHPLAGQGVNLGFADAQELSLAVAAALVAGENPGDLPGLRKYERARKGSNKTMLHFMDALNKLFSNESASLSRFRGAGMGLFNKSGPIRERVVQTALGIR